MFNSSRQFKEEQINIPPQSSTPKAPSLLLASLENNEFLPPVNPWMMLGGLALVGVVITLFILASVLKYNSVVRAQAKIRPAGELRLVQSAIDAVVKKITVRENQLVKKGDVIALLDDTKLNNKRKQIQDQIEKIKLKITETNQQINTLDIQIESENNHGLHTVNLAEAQLDLRKRNYKDKEITASKDAQEAQANLKSAQQERLISQAELIAEKEDLNATESAVQFAQTKVDRYQNYAKDGVLSQDQIEGALLSLKQQQQLLKSKQANINAKNAKVAQLDYQIQAAKTKFEITQVFLNPSQAEVTIASEQIGQAKTEGQTKIANLLKERNALIQQKIELQTQSYQNLQELKQIDFDATQLTIKATDEGTVTNLSLRNANQTVRAGEEIAKIVPRHSSIVIKALIEPKEIGKLKLQQKVNIKVSACPYPDYGTLKGTVSEISQDAVKSPEVSPSLPENNLSTASALYEVTIQPESLVLIRGNNQCSIQLGMEGKAEIITKEETILRFLLREVKLVTDF